jgi:hypothetical protein
MNLHPVVLAAYELQEALKDFGRPFCFIGGLALQRWGQPRYTSDADATLLTEWIDDESAVDFLTILPRLTALMRKRDVID